MGSYHEDQSNRCVNILNMSRWLQTSSADVVFLHAFTDNAVPKQE